MPRRTREDRGRAARRVSAEGPEPLELLLPLLGHPLATCVRWAIHGRRGVYLDALHRPGVGWMSSRPAVERFRQAAGLDHDQQSSCCVP